MRESGIIAALRAKRPLVHCIANIVTANDCANVLYAAGASPMMAEAVEEMVPVTALADSAVLNTGTPSAAKYAAAKICLVESLKLGKPVVLDPVGAGSNEWRRENIAAILECGSPDIVRVNLAEAEALLGMGGSEMGVDIPGRSDMELRTSVAERLASSLGCTVLLTGECDAVSDGTRTETVSGGSAMLPLITGGGCMLSALCGAFVAVERDAYIAALSAARYWKRCAELAEKYSEGRGPGSLRQSLMDAAHAMTDEAMN